MKSLNVFINESQNESQNPVEDYPNVLELGNGEFNGALWGHCFAYEGKKYYSDMGWRNAFPIYCKMIIENDKAIPQQTDKYQRPDLKKLFE